MVPGMNFFKYFQLVLLLLVLLTGCAVFKDSSQNDTRQYNWEVQAVLRSSYATLYHVPSNFQTTPLINFPEQTNEQGFDPVVITQEYENFTPEQISELRMRLLTSGNYFVVSYRKLPVTTAP